MGIVVCLALALASPSQAVGAQEAPLSAKGNWKRVLTEEFATERLNRDRWTTCYWWDDNGCTNLGNNELQWYVPDNVSVAKGRLRLTARRQSVTGYKGRKFDFTSGMVTTGRDYAETRPLRFEFQYGLIEVRARIPAGRGLWPALWLLPSDRRSRPEIDIMEVLGHTPNLLRMHFHYDDETGAKRSLGKTVKTVNLSKGWHVYGLRWERDAIVWYLDGVEKWRHADAATIPREPMYLLLNLAVGGDWPGPPDARTKFPAHYLIDYVRVWQRAGP
jgi:beta-glucanase (GH16 family)